MFWRKLCFYFCLLLYFHLVCCSYSGDDYTRTNFQGVSLNKHPLETIRFTLHLMHHKYPHVLERDCFLNNCYYSRALAIIKDNREATLYWSLLQCDKFGITCPLSGQWGQWQAWSKCNKVCGPEQKIRFRDCNDPYPQYGGGDCKGKNYQIAACGPQYGTDCLRDGRVDIGSWSLWTQWSACGATCGYSTKFQRRECRPVHMLFHKKCVGKSEKTLPCLVAHCEVSGNWEKWGPWHDCSTKHTCGRGYQHRVRQCNNPYPVGGKDKDCVGPSSSWTICRGPECKVERPPTAHFLANSFLRYYYMEPANFLNLYVKFMPTSMTGTIFQYSTLDAEFLYSMTSSTEKVQEDFMYCYLTARDNIRIKVSINGSTELDMLVGFAKIGSWNDVKVSIVSDTITARINSGENVVGKLWEYPQMPPQEKDEVLLSKLNKNFKSWENALGFNLSLGNLSQTSEDFIEAVSEVTDTLAESFELQERKVFAQFDGQIVLGKARADKPSFKGSFSHLVVNFKKYSLMPKQAGFTKKYLPVGYDFVEFTQGQKWRIHDLDASLPYFHGSQVIKYPLESAWWHNGASEGIGIVAHFEITFMPETNDGIILYTQGTYNKACMMKLFLYNQTNIKLMLSVSGAVHSVHIEDIVVPGQWNIATFQLSKNMMMRLLVNGRLKEVNMPTLKPFDDLGNVLYIGGAKHRSSLEKELNFKNAAIASHLHWYQGYIFRVVLNQMSIYLQTMSHTNSFGMPSSYLLATPPSWKQYTFEKLDPPKPDPRTNKTVVNSHNLKCLIPQLSDRELSYSTMWLRNDIPVVPSNRIWVTEDRSGNELTTNLHFRVEDENPADMSGVYQCMLRRNEQLTILSTFVVAMLYDEQTEEEATSLLSAVRHLSYFAGVNIMPFIVMGAVILALVLILITVAVIKGIRKRHHLTKNAGDVTKEEATSLIGGKDTRKKHHSKKKRKDAKGEEKMSLLEEDENNDEVIYEKIPKLKKKHKKPRKHHHHKKKHHL